MRSSVNVVAQIQTVLGGNVKLVVSGSAAISAEVLDFLKIALACDIVEGGPSIIILAVFDLLARRVSKTPRSGSQH
jgi:hypothetical protein